jgi:hypothetical protein
MNDPQRPKLPAPRAQSAGTLPADRGQDAGNVPDGNPHSRAERAPDSVPLPVPPSEKNGARPRAPRTGRAKKPTDRNAGYDEPAVPTWARGNPPAEVAS